MYDIANSLYPLKLTEFVKRVQGTFIVAGAFCTITTKSGQPIQPNTPGQSGNIIVNSRGFNYSNTRPGISPSVTSITEEDMLINFIFYKKFEKKLELVGDVPGKIYLKDGKYHLEILNQATIIDFLPHYQSELVLKQQGPLTLDNLKTILDKVRAMFLLDALDKLNDVLPVPSPQSEKDILLDKIKSYLQKALAKGYLFDLLVKSTTDVIDKKLLSLVIHKKDNSKATKELLSMDLFARKYEPAIVFTGTFENDADPIRGVFRFLEDNEESYTFKKNISIDEVDYFIKGIQRIASELTNYHYVTDVTP
nr:MAG TPA: hypothetical protein [Caudoviricetes sp.]